MRAPSDGIGDSTVDCTTQLAASMSQDLVGIGSDKEFTFGTGSDKEFTKFCARVHIVCILIRAFPCRKKCELGGRVLFMQC